MDGGAILLILLIILVVMIPALMVYTVIVGGEERARERERPRKVSSPAPVGTSVRDAPDMFSEGLRLLRSGDFPAAVREFSAAITLDANHWTAHFRRAEAYRNLGMEEEARADLERAEFLMATDRRKPRKVQSL